MPSQKPSRRPRRGKKSPPASRPVKVLLAALFLLGFLLGSLVLLSHLRESLRPAPPKPPELPTLTESPPKEDWSLMREDLEVEVESALLRSGVALAQVKATIGGDRISYDIRSEFPSEGILEDLTRRVERGSDRIRLNADPVAGQVAILRDEEPWFLLRFQPPAKMVSLRKGPRMAIIMDDLGRSPRYAQDILNLDIPVTVAILPGEPYAAKVAGMAHRQGREVMIHIPMEPQSYPTTNPGSDALLVSHSPEEIRRRIRGFLKKVPYAVGGNNHMGSRFTENRGQMAVVLKEMKEAGLFFVDSLTSGQSVAFTEARKAGLPAAIRDRFLDNVQDTETISKEIRRLARVAESRGSAVGICHPYPQTLKALRRESAFLREQGIEVVPVSELLIR